MNKRQRKKTLKRELPDLQDFHDIPTMKEFGEVMRIARLLKHYRDTAAEAIQMAPKAPWIGMDLASGPDMSVVWSVPQIGIGPTIIEPKHNPRDRKRLFPLGGGK